MRYVSAIDTPVDNAHLSQLSNLKRDARAQ